MAKKNLRKTRDANPLIMVAIAIAIVVFGGFALSDGNILTGAATTQSTQSQVTISYYYAITLSNNLSNGIDFGTITSLPVSDADATDNYNFGANLTSMWVLLSNDSNINIDICIRAQSPLNTTGGSTIGLGNYTWSDSKTNSAISPAGPGGATVFTTNFVKGLNNNIVPSNKGYYRYWLDIPIGQAAGIYTNTVDFKAVYTGSSC